MSGQYQHLCYLYMGRSIGCIYSYIGYIVASKGLDSFIHVSGTFTIAMETDIAEVRFHKSRL